MYIQRSNVWRDSASLNPSSDHEENRTTLLPLDAMAAISVLSLGSWSQLSVARTGLLEQVKQAERRTFPRNEALDFDTELAKRNVHFTIIAEDVTAPGPARLVAYLVLARIKSTATVHKLCVLDQYRRLGVASQLLRLQCEQAKRSGCTRIQLWVDGERTAAQSLYSKVGFDEVERVNDYYAPGRTGIRMVHRS